MTPRFPRLQACAIAPLAALLLAGCASLPPGQPAAHGAADPLATARLQLSSLLDGLGALVGGTQAEFSRLVESGELDQAHALYAKNQPSLDASASAAPSITQLAQRLNERQAPALQACADQLAALDRPDLAPQDWAAATALLQQAQALLQAREADVLLRQPPFVSEPAKALQGQVRALQQTLASAAGAQLERHQVGSAASIDTFFSTYPLSMTEQQQRRLLQDRVPALLQALPTWETEHGARVLADYLQRQALDADSAAAVLSAWHQAYAREKGWPAAPLTRARRLESGQHLMAKLPQWPYPVVRVTVVPLIDPKLNPARQQAARQAVEQMAQRWAARVEPPSTLDDAARRLASWPAGESDLVALVELGRITGVQAQSGTHPQQARYLARHDNIPNPRHRQLQQELAQAEQEWRQAEQAEQQAQQQAKSIASQSRSGLGAMAVLGLISTSTFNSVAQKSNVEKLSRELGNTPTHVATPVYEPYERTVVQGQLMVAAPATVYLYDPAERTLGALDLDQARIEDIAHVERIHPNDPEAASLAQPPTPQRIDAIGLELLGQLPAQLPQASDLAARPQARGADLQAQASQARQRQRQWLEQQKQPLVRLANSAPPKAAPTHRNAAEVVTADGFSFSIQYESWDDHPVLIGDGGPCRAVGYDLVRTSVLGQAQYGGNSRALGILEVESKRDQNGWYRAQSFKPGDSFSSENCQFGGDEKQCIERWACLRTAHGQYFTAVDNWIRGNKNLIRKEYEKYLKKNKGPNSLSEDQKQRIEAFLGQ